MKHIKIICTLCALFILAGCQSAPAPQLVPATTAAIKKPVYALIVKDTVNPYMQVMYQGFQQGSTEIGAVPLLAGPDENNNPPQQDLIAQLIAQGVSGICVAANNRSELSDALQKALSLGIPVVSLDSAVDPQDRILHIEQAPADVVGRVLIQAGSAILQGHGNFAILTTTQNASNQANWLHWMNKEYTDNPDTYANMHLLDVAYGQDDYSTSYQVTLDLLQKHPDLDLIIAPTSVGLLASADAIEGCGSHTKVTGLGLPSDMQTHILSGVCPWMYLWNPADLGYLAVYAVNLIRENKLLYVEGAIFTAGSLGGRIITRANDGGTEVVLDNPIMFDITNVAVWAELF